jgi:GT2 family glycosyltransferase
MIWNDIVSYLIKKLDWRPIRLGKIVDLSKHHHFGEGGIPTKPKVSIIIPTKDKPELLKRCIDSITQYTKDSNYDLLVVDNNSKEPETALYLAELKRQGVTVLSYPEKFNYSAICNLAAEKATGEYLCFLNNDTEVREPKWLSSMLEHASQPSVGLVGAVLTFPNEKLQHMGVALGYTGVAGHPGRGKDPETIVPKNCFEVSAITFACAVVSVAKYKSLDGLNVEFPVAFNDVDMCIRASKSNLLNVVCTRAHLVHGESQSRSRTLSIGGFLRGVKDVLLLLNMHNRSLTENFFVRGVLPDKLGK